MAHHHPSRPRYVWYSGLAYAVVVFHGLWSLLVFVGVILVPFYHPYAWVQLVVLSITLFSGMIFDTDCPLTILEERLRKKTDSSFRGNHSFVATYFNKIFGTRFTTHQANTAIAIIYLLSYFSIAAVLIHY